MENEIIKCRECGQLMFEIGQIGGTKEITQPIYEIIAGMECMTGVKVIGIKSIKLYQCPECKTIAID